MRIATVALAMAMMAVPLAAPFIDVLIARGGWRWLGAYGLIVAMGAAATALAVGLTVALFRLIGAKRTRLVAQVVAAVIGAAFVIGLQVAAILSYGTISRVSRAAIASRAGASRPMLGSLFWWPARAALGDGIALVGVLAVSFALLAARHRAGRAALRRICASLPPASAPAFQSASARRADRVPADLAAARAAAQGMDAAAARSVAGVADADADALSHSAGGAAVAQF